MLPFRRSSTKNHTKREKKKNTCTHTHIFCSKTDNVDQKNAVCHATTQFHMKFFHFRRNKNCTCSTRRFYIFSFFVFLFLFPSRFIHMSQPEVGKRQYYKNCQHSQTPRFSSLRCQQLDTPYITTTVIHAWYLVFTQNSGYPTLTMPGSVNTGSSLLISPLSFSGSTM